ncbi:hypothetical protein [Endozoicomonas sp. SCSIO W0465]|uniref:hypothetical protein n=1 Tax=Endozoicomonas sp. SCSIO W0465 TaxID=2918516 RepID=UPI0020756EFB|nr:hypothetical protein [Endozoicomonas sp. SCSIO W0465]USE38015.1 hypothetical protein MJO57_07505 [Endozoicomonas sp. SCSIO W0465]
MNPSEKPQTNYTAQWTDVSLKNEQVASCKETTDSNGHLVKQMSPIPSTLQQAMPPSSFDLFDEKTRPHHSGLPGIRIITGELSGRSAQQSPKLTPAEISHSHQLILPSATINKPDDQATKALRDKLITLAGIPSSRYQRQFPNHASCDTRNVSSYLRSEPIRNMVKDIMHQYQLWEDREFNHYLLSKKLSGAFNPESFMWDTPYNLLEIVVHYVFQEDHILRNISFSGAHGYGLSYCDHEILTEHKPVRSEFVRKIEIKYSSYAPC